MSPLSERQREVLAYVQTCLAQTQKMPTLRAIGGRFGFSSCVALRHLRALERKGALDEPRRCQERPKGADGLPKLTVRQLAVLAEIEATIVMSGAAPSIEQLARALKIADSATRAHLQALASKRCLEWKPGQSRSFVVTDLGLRCLRAASETSRRQTA